MTRDIRALLREAVASAISGRLASLVTIALVAAMCAAVLLTSGRAVGAQQQVLATIDSSGTRAIIVRASPEAGLDSTVLSRLTPIGGIETAFALGPATDVRNSSLPDGAPVAVRDYWGPSLGATASGDEVFLSPRAVRALGMVFAGGSVSRDDGVTWSVAGTIRDVAALADFEPLALTPRTDADVGPVGVLVVIASDARIVAPLTATIRPLIAAEDPRAVSVNSSEALASLRGSVQTQLGAFGNTLAAGVLILTGRLVALVQGSMVMLRRRDFGRRRALGATRSLIVTLILVQTVALAVLGVALGALASTIALTAAGDPLPTLDYTAAVATLAITVSILAAIAPAILAARREPIKELRVP